MMEQTSTAAIIVRNEEVARPLAEMTTYERLVVDDIARHQVQPGPVRRVLELVGKPVDKLARWAQTSDSAMVRRVHDSVVGGVDKALRGTIQASLSLQNESNIITRFQNRGNRISTFSEIRGLGLMEMDIVAESNRTENATMIGAEGAALGALATLGTVIPYAQVAIPAIVAADVAASMTLLSRSATMIASSYGFPASDPVNLPHVLAAMAPTQLDSDEGFLVVKTAAVAELKAAGEFMKAAAKEAAVKASSSAATQATKRAIQHAVEEVMTARTPKLVKLINMVATRLGVVLTEKELGTLIPVAGAVMNGGLNMAFHHVGHTLAKDYFRTQILTDRYGTEAVTEAISIARKKYA